jgi:peptidoglycan/xylan/chitin deacetylase (PgdA/CDA1 family)
MQQAMARKYGGGRRALVAHFMLGSGALRLVRGFRSGWISDLRVLAYHRVLPEHMRTRLECDFDGDLELVSCWEEDFDWQIRTVARDFEPMTCRDVLQWIAAGRALPRRAVVVTFDDGFADNAEVAAPILRAHRVPAVFFVATSYIDDGQPFWFNDLVRRLKAAPAHQCIDLAAQRVALGPAEERAQITYRVLSHLKRVPDAARRQFLEQVADEMPLPSEDGDPWSRPMDWQQVRELHAAGHEIGSHTCTHPILAQMESAGQLTKELQESRARIEQMVGAKCESLAYPVGGASAISPGVLAAVRAAGYGMACTYQAGVNRCGELDLLQLKRIAVERYTSRELFRMQLELPEIFP